MRKTVSQVVEKAFGKADQCYEMVRRLDKKLCTLDELYKTDSARLTELARLDKHVERLGNCLVELTNK